MQQSNASTKITDLNDDVLYGMFSYLDLEDLDSSINANDRFKLVARYAYRRRYHCEFLFIQHLFRKVPKMFVLCFASISEHGSLFPFLEISNEEKIIKSLKFSMKCWIWFGSLRRNTDGKVINNWFLCSNWCRSYHRPTARLVCSILRERQKYTLKRRCRTKTNTMMIPWNF